MKRIRIVYKCENLLKEIDEDIEVYGADFKGYAIWEIKTCVASNGQKVSVRLCTDYLNEFDADLIKQGEFAEEMELSKIKKIFEEENKGFYKNEE